MFGARFLLAIQKVLRIRRGGLLWLGVPVFGQWQQHEAFSGLSNNHLRQAWTLNCQFLDPILHGNDQMMIDDITILKSDI